MGGIGRESQRLLYYGDENARCLLGVITTSSILRETKWDERIWLAVLANFRLMGRLGHRKWRHDEAPLNKNGWRYYYEYWASSTDAGWGAWSTESGWSQSWLSTVLGLRLLKRSLWDVIAGAKSGSVFERLRTRMLPE